MTGYNAGYFVNKYYLIHYKVCFLTYIFLLYLVFVFLKGREMCFGFEENCLYSQTVN